IVVALLVSVVYCVKTSSNLLDIKLVWHYKLKWFKINRKTACVRNRSSSCFDTSVILLRCIFSSRCKENLSICFKQLVSGTKTTPSVSIPTPTPEDLNGKSKFFLLCLVTGFYPEKIKVTWQVDGGKYEDGITGEPLGTGDESSVISQFKVSKEDWDKGNMYSCNARQASQEGRLVPSMRTHDKPLLCSPSVFCVWSFSHVVLFCYSM
uniref:Ig-like domain-containing protein n=1 Tax=Paramormyrops kingsleyae TaxID=1676925 RepID=A0A3B3QAT5_9TELE